MQRVFTNSQDIINALESQQDILKQLGVQSIGLFGSYARGEQTSQSDLDFIVTIEPFTFASWMDVWNFLEDHFQQSVDLVPEKDLREELQPSVLREAIYVPIR